MLSVKWYLMEINVMFWIIYTFNGLFCHYSVQTKKYLYFSILPSSQTRPIKILIIINV